MPNGLSFDLPTARLVLRQIHPVLSPHVELGDLGNVYALGLRCDHMSKVRQVR